MKKSFIKKRKFRKDWERIKEIKRKIIEKFVEGLSEDKIIEIDDIEIEIMGGDLRKEEKEFIIGVKRIGEGIKDLIIRDIGKKF